MNGDRIEVYTSKKRLLKLVFYAVCLIGMSIFVIFISEEQHMVPSMVAELIGYASLLLFIPAMFYMVYKLSDHSPVLIIDSVGLTDHTSATSPGFIPWREIKSFEVKKVHSTPLLGIVLKDPATISKKMSPLSRFLNQLNTKMMSSSYMISTATLDIEFNKLEELIRSYHQKYTG